MTELNADAFTRLLALASEEEWAERLRCFKTGAGEYAEHDTFVGVRMGEVFRLAKEFIGTPTDSWLYGIPATQPTMSPGNGLCARRGTSPGVIDAQPRYHSTWTRSCGTVLQARKPWLPSPMISCATARDGVEVFVAHPRSRVMTPWVRGSSPVRQVPGRV